MVPLMHYATEVDLQLYAILSYSDRLGSDPQTELWLFATYIFVCIEFPKVDI